MPYDTIGLDIVSLTLCPCETCGEEGERVRREPLMCNATHVTTSDEEGALDRKLQNRVKETANGGTHEIHAKERQDTRDRVRHFSASKNFSTSCSSSRKSLTVWAIMSRAYMSRWKSRSACCTLDMRLRCHARHPIVSSNRLFS